MFFGGKMKSMPPKLVSDDGKHIVIRPLAYCKEKDLIRYADWKEFPIIPCNLCGSQENLQRKAIKQMLNDWDKRFPGRIDIMFRSLQNVVPSHLLDGQLFNIKALDRSFGVVDGGDIAFDKPDFSQPTLDFESDEETRLEIIEVQ